MNEETPRSSTPPRWRVWPAWWVIGLATGVIVVARSQSDWPFQKRNLWTASVVLLAALALLLWWIGFSRGPWRKRLWGLAGVGVVLLGFGSMFRLKGVTGDFVPIWEARWHGTQATSSAEAPAPRLPAPTAKLQDFPQFLGPNRNAILTGLQLSRDWATTPPRILWRQPIGAAWSGFAIVGDRAYTQEQHGAEEWITAYELETGKRLWAQTNLARYDTTIAGEGPRATPTVVSNRVYTLGATGILDALDRETGRKIWSRSLNADAQRSPPDWGYSGSPLVHRDLVIVQAGGGENKALLAYRTDTGAPAWSAGNAGINYGSPFFTALGGRDQVLVFGGRAFVGHDPITGAVLWEVPFGTGMPLVANPIVVSPDRVLVTAGYNVGAELFAFTPTNAAPVSLWKSKKLKAKFANPVLHDGFVYGLDDGMLVCLDVKDGSQRWKEGRYGHGQGLWVDGLYLLMSEPGELILLQPTPTAPQELARFPVFSAKTWNPIALRGDRLLVRNDREAACLQLPLRSP